jgi:MFS family permease
MQNIDSIEAARLPTERTNKTAWLVVATSSIGLFLHFGSLLVNTFGVFLTELCNAFGWTRGQVSMAFMLATLTAMASMPVTGWAADRFGARRPILFSMAVFGVFFTSLGFLTSSLVQLYVVFLILGLVGPGTSAVPHASLITRWFSERRGLALGIAMCGTAFGGVIWPSLSQGLIDRIGWRNSYLALGGAVLLVAMPLIGLFLKEPPVSTPSQTAEQSKEAAEGMTRSQALRSGLFWLLIAAFFIVSGSIQAAMIHLAPMLKDRGMTPAAAALAASVMGAAGMIGRLGMGYLLDLMPAARVPTIAFSSIAAGIFLLFAGVSGPAAYLAAALIGVGYGAESATIPYLVSRYFGLRSFGELYSYIFITVPLGGALGPALMGVGFDRTGSYRMVLLSCGVATVIAALMMLRLGSYSPYRSIE